MSVRPMATLACVLALTACSSTITTEPPKTSATQQLIVSSSEAKAIASLPAVPIPGSAYVDPSDFTGSKYELAAFKAWLLGQGTPLSDNQKTAAVIVVPFTGVDSYDLKSLLVGIPAFKIAALMSTPEIALYGKSTEIAINQIGFYAYDRATGRLVVAETSKYGLQPYSVTRALFVFTRESPKIAPDQRAP
jgi:hypothetical protein